MCGVARKNNTRVNRVLEEPFEASVVMPPSITLGTDPPKPTPPPNDEMCQVVHQEEQASNKEIPTIDLASDDAELQKAIALSLQDQTPEHTALAGISAEERDVSKVIEDSIFDATPRTTVDLLNPHDRRRVIGTPVGMKNIGNSCWFNVVIQPLFFIPTFRDMIIQFPKSLDDEFSHSCSKENSRKLVPTLRELLSLLIASDKKYIDPTEAVSLFQGNGMRKNTQQDVCEFIHKLLEKLEEEFKLLLKKQGVEKESLETNLNESDFMKLFYGQSRKEIDEDDGGPKLETFGQYPLTVKQYKDLHESILASMTNGSSLDNKEIIQQDTWFKTLPSVLIFSLSRYEFSKEKQRAEKVHNKFEFPEYLFMDRYMESNKEIIREKHKKVAKIKQALNNLYISLEKYEKYGSGVAKYPLVDILKYILEFAESKGSKLDELNIQPLSTMEVDTLDGLDNDVEMAESEDESNSKHKMSIEDKVDLPIEHSDVIVEMSPNKRMRVLPPAPQTINSCELTVLQGCIPRWKREVELQVDNLKKTINELEQQLVQVFEEPFLHCIPYKLHAVVVHEGQASGGHYWVYIFDSFKSVWMKFNDIQVTTSNWEELLQESVGGQNNASAYCLMYIDETKYKMLFSNSETNAEDVISDLPIDLQDYVKQDNAEFLRELQEWESKQENQSVINDADSRAVPATAPNSPDILCLDDEETTNIIEMNTMLFQVLSKSLQDEKEVMKQANKKAWVVGIINQDVNRLKDIAGARMKSDPFAEPSILDLGIYMIKNKESDILLRWYAYEILWHVTQSKNTKSLSWIREEAEKVLHQMKEKYSANFGMRYQSWKKHFLALMDCTWHFLNGFRKLQTGNIEIALVFLKQALKIHKHISETPPDGCAKTLDIKILSFCHRKCLQIMNDKLVDLFISVESESKAQEIVEKVIKIVAPAVWIVTNSTINEDQLVGDSIRARWCQTLEEVPQSKAPLIRQIIEVVANDSCEMYPYTAVKCPSLPSVLSMYKEYRDTVILLRNSFEKTDTQTSDL